MIKINVLVTDKKWKKYINNPEFYLKKKIKRLKSKNIYFAKKSFEFTLLLSGEKEIKKLNKKFRNKNKSTDILSFPFYEKKELFTFFKKKQSCYLGDININVCKIIENSKNKNLIELFDKLWIHGLLHLLGFKHKLNKDYIKMQRLEKKIFNSLN